MVKTEYDILKCIEKAKLPLGAIYLSKELNIPQATVGRMLSEMERDGLLTKVGMKGRVVSEKGVAALDEEELKQIRNSSIEQLIQVPKFANPKSLLEIMDVRIILEEKTAELACINKTETQMILLEKTLIDCRLCIAQGKTGESETRNLHVQIAEMSGNRTLSNMCALLLNQYNAYSYIAKLVQDPAIELKQHEDIVAAIKSEDTVTAKATMKLHLESIRSDILARLPNNN